MTSWRFLDTGARDGATNMAIDEALLLGVQRGSSRPTVRVYAWDPPTVSTGHSQRAEDELDLAACGRAGVGVVRRPTGGRAVLHAGELTYSVTGPSCVPPLGGTIMESYRAVALGLIAALRSLGVDAEFERVATEARGREGGASPPCFVSAGRFEIVVGGRKLVGSAQRRAEGAVLQHGSLLLDGTHAGLADLVHARNERERAVLRRSLESKTTDLSTILGRGVAFDEIAPAIRGGFGEAWGIELAEGPLTEPEMEEAQHLATGYELVA